jgi:hypothetical protein
MLSFESRPFTIFESVANQASIATFKSIVATVSPSRDSAR